MEVEKSLLFDTHKLCSKVNEALHRHDGQDGDHYSMVCPLVSKETKELRKKRCGFETRGMETELCLG